MPDDRQLWKDVLAAYERSRDEHVTQLKPLEDGTMRLGKRGPDTGGVWVDVTDQEIANLKRIIANLDGLIAKVRERPSDA